MLCLSIDGQSISTPIQLYRGAKSPRLPFKQAGALSSIVILLDLEDGNFRVMPPQDPKSSFFRLGSFSY